MTVDEIITPQTLKIVREEGMPIDKDSGEDIAYQLKSVIDMPKGDLYIRFDIQFPKKIKNEYKEAIIAALKANEED